MSSRKGVKRTISSDYMIGLLLLHLGSSKIWLRDVTLRHICGSRPLIRKKGLSSKGPATSEDDTTTPALIIIRSRCCKGKDRIIMRDKTGLDDYDNHHRRIGEEDIKEEDIREQEPNDIDKKTSPTTSTMISSIIDHIICAISQNWRKEVAQQLVLRDSHGNLHRHTLLLHKWVFSFLSKAVLYLGSASSQVVL